ncbi:unnamed protein product [Musa banksii]
MNGCLQKKQRLPNQGATSDGEMLDGQIVKYQPLTDEAAKAMLRQILKMTMLESLINLDNHLIENFQSLSETFEKYFNSGFSASTAAVAEMIGTVKLTNIGVLSAVPGYIAPSTILLTFQLGIWWWICHIICMLVHVSENLYVNPLTLDEAMRLETDDFLAHTDINFHDDEEKLPDIMHAF